MARSSKGFQIPLLAVSFMIIPQLGLAVDLDPATIKGKLANEKEKTIFVTNSDWSRSYFKYLFAQSSEAFNDRRTSDPVFAQYNLASTDPAVREQYYAKFLVNLNQELAGKTFDAKFTHRVLKKLGDYLDSDPELAVQKLITQGLKSQNYKIANLFITAAQEAFLNHDPKNTLDKVAQALKNGAMNEYLQAISRFENDNKGASDTDAEYHFKAQKSYQNYEKLFAEEANCKDNSHRSYFWKMTGFAANIMKAADHAIRGDEAYRAKKAEQKAISKAAQDALKVAAKHYGELSAKDKLITQQLKATAEKLNSLAPFLMFGETSVLTNFKTSVEATLKQANVHVEAAEAIAKQAELDARKSIQDNYAGTIVDQAMETVKSKIQEHLAPVKNRFISIGSLSDLAEIMEYTVGAQMAPSQRTEYDLKWDRKVEKNGGILRSEFSKAGSLNHAFSNSDYKNVPTRLKTVPPRHVKTTLADLAGASPTASYKELVKAYRQAALIKHPDKPTGNKDEFTALSNAYSNFLEIYGKNTQEWNE